MQKLDFIEMVLPPSTVVKPHEALVQFCFNEELIDIEDTDETEAGERLKGVVTSQN